MLYGKYVANGKIDLETTIGDLGINERGEGLSALERTARVRDLLTSSSGVYWPAGSPSGSSLQTPARGSKKPGAFFFYNNWDFNVAGAVFQRLTGKSVFQALDEDLARPLQFQDFDLKRQKMLGYDNDPSLYKSYQMFLSGRDLARLGLLMVNGGAWNGKQLISAAWIQESTALRFPAAAGRPMGYPTFGGSPPEWVDSFLPTDCGVNSSYVCLQSTPWSCIDKWSLTNWSSPTTEERSPAHRAVDSLRLLISLRSPT